MPSQPQHKVSIVINGQQIDGWSQYLIGSSMIHPADNFTLSRPFDAAIYRLLETDAKIKVKIDDTLILVGYLDEVTKESDRDTSLITIMGRDGVGHMVQESAPFISYDGIDLLQVAKLLATPWYPTVVLSDARNRSVRRGKFAKKAASAAEPLIVKVRKKTWQVEPGQSRWKILEELVSEAGYLCWAAADGSELIIGKPNYSQEVQFLLTHPAINSSLSPTCTKFKLVRSVADRFSLYMTVGSGQGDAVNYGRDVSTRKGVVRDGTNADGTGRDFQFPKRLVLSEHHLANTDEATARAKLEQAKRDFKRLSVDVSCNSHGQFSGGSAATIFAPNTLARVIDEEQDLPFDEVCLIHSVKYSSTRDDGETTELQLVPTGTTIVQ